MTLDDAINEVLRHAPAFDKLIIYPAMMRNNKHTVIADGIFIQGDQKIEEVNVNNYFARVIRSDER